MTFSVVEMYFLFHVLVSIIDGTSHSCPCFTEAKKASNSLPSPRAAVPKQIHLRLDVMYAENQK